jgi:hypothetical protein
VLLLEHDVRLLNATTLVMSQLTADPFVQMFDVSGFGWNFMADHTLLHPSQFNPEFSEYLKNAATSYQKNYFLKASDAIPNDPLYSGLCD